MSKINGLTIAAIASCAFVAADIAHEGVGHGVAYLALGGQSFVLSTTRVVPNAPGVDPYRMFSGQPHAELSGRLFAIAGPAGSFLLAAFCLTILTRPRLTLQARLFCWFSAAFSLFWACGYIAYSGLARVGDYFELIVGLGNEFLYRILLVLVGGGLYLLAAQLLRRRFPLPYMQPNEDARSVLLIGYLSAIVTASLGAALDPRGPVRVLYDAIPETLFACAPMLLMRKRLNGNNATELSRAKPDFLWVLTGLAVLLFYVLILGPGLSIHRCGQIRRVDLSLISWLYAPHPLLSLLLKPQSEDHQFQPSGSSWK